MISAGYLFFSWTCLFTLWLFLGANSDELWNAAKKTREKFLPRNLWRAPDGRTGEQILNLGSESSASVKTILMSPIGHHYGQHPVIINAIKILFLTICQRQAECRAGSGNHELFEKSTHSPAVRGLWQWPEWDVSCDRIVRSAAAPHVNIPFSINPLFVALEAGSFSTESLKMSLSWQSGHVEFLSNKFWRVLTISTDKE